jgi:hypothetical protein
MLTTATMRKPSFVMTTSALSQVPRRASLMDLPLVQLTLAKDGTSNKILTLCPANLPDLLMAQTLEFARRQPIADATFDRLACALCVEPTKEFCVDIQAAIVGATMMITRKWWSPRKLAELLEGLKRDPLKVLDEARNDSFVELVVTTIRNSVKATGKSSDAVIEESMAAIREAIPRGRPDEEARSIFFEAVVAIAQKYSAKLTLPPRDDSRGAKPTVLFIFAEDMCKAVIEYGTNLELPPTRLAGFALKRRRLIFHLEAARSTILQEKSVGSVNSPKRAI